MINRRLHREFIRTGSGATFFTKRVAEKFTPFHWHSHPELEIILSTKGKGRLYVGDAIEPFSAGSLYLLGSGLPHSWYTDPADGPVSSLLIQFSADAIEKIGAAASEFRDLKTALRRAGRGLRIVGTARETISGIVRRMFKRPSWSWRHMCDLLAILGSLSESRDCITLCSAQTPESRSERGNKPIDRIFSLLHRPPDQIPTQAIAARSIGLSPQSFSRFFHRTVGKTYSAYVGDMRLARACRELIETDSPIIDIAFATGFTSLSNFNRCFRLSKKTNPRRFRAQYRKVDRQS